MTTVKKPAGAAAHGTRPDGDGPVNPADQVQAHLAGVYGAQVSRETIRIITGRMLDGLAGWQSRPLDMV